VKDLYGRQQASTTSSRPVALLIPSPLFSGDLERQHLKLMDMIAAALDQRELFQSLIHHTGRQHARFGVKPSHFGASGEALIWSLEQQFGPQFTPELKRSWIALYDVVQCEMRQAAK
jgi:hemoglobin-like flavoprotein